MTKVEAIIKVLEANGGIAVWSLVYNQIESYYPNIKRQKDWKAGVRGVFYRDLGKSFKMLDNGTIALINYNEINLLLNEDLNDTTKSIETKIRIGQEKFRKHLLKDLKYCPITGVDDKRLLLASHIKPWALSNNSERLDIYNGFIFSPNIDKLFDNGLITFENNKELVVSKSLSEKNITLIGLEAGKKYLNLPIENRYNYLEYHRNNIFIYE